MLRSYACQSNWRHILMSLLSSKLLICIRRKSNSSSKWLSYTTIFFLFIHQNHIININLHAISVSQQLQAAFLNGDFLPIHSSKSHYKPFSRLKLCLHPILNPLNVLSLAKLSRNDLDKSLKKISLNGKIKRGFPFFR